MTRRRAALAAVPLVLLVAAALAGCGGGSGSTPRLTVFAAASLTNVMPQIDPHARYSFAGSNALATQIEQGQPADVFASANTQLPAELYRRHLVTKPVDFTANELTIIVPKGNPRHIRSVYDLERKGLRVVMAAAGVPAGDYTRSVLGRLGLSDLVRKAVSQETDVRQVLAKVVLGEADAGFVYTTDAKTVANKVALVPIPRKAEPTVVYAAAAVRASAHEKEAKAWVARLRDRPAQRLLQAAGFRPLPR